MPTPRRGADSEVDMALQVLQWPVVGLSFLSTGHRPVRCNYKERTAPLISILGLFSSLVGQRSGGPHLCATADGWNESLPLLTVSMFSQLRGGIYYRDNKLSYLTTASLADAERPWTPIDVSQL